VVAAEFALGPFAEMLRGHAGTSNSPPRWDKLAKISPPLPIATVCGALQRTAVVNAATTGRSSMAVWPPPSLNADDLDDALQRVKIGGIARIERQPVGRGC